MHPACLTHDELLRQCEQRSERRSGPGGQHRNKVETAVVLSHLPTGIRAEANERRSQVENKAAAVFRLRLALALRYRDLQQLREGPSATWEQRVQRKRIAVSPSHDDFPKLLAECLDVLEELDYDLAATAAFLQVSPSQLVKLLRSHPPALIAVNESRALRGQHKLR